MSDAEYSALEEHLRKFLDMAQDMLTRDEFLFPYLWAQRQFREDQYQMASAAQLEDLFFDTLGAYVNQYVPGEEFSRRQGSEPWDYMFAGEALSHKEGIQPGLTAVWQPGEGPGNRQVKYARWDFRHPVVFVYTPRSVSVRWTSSGGCEAGDASQFHGQIWHVSHGSLELPSLRTAPIFLGRLHGNTLEVLQGWDREEWTSLGVHELRAVVGQPRPLEVDFWLDKSGRVIDLLGASNSNPGEAVNLALESDPLMPGLYVFPPDELSDVPLASNNKAHFVPKEQVERLMRQAVASGRFVPLPMWPMEFADVTPPNLYAQQRRRYDEYMAARSRNAST